MRRSVAPSQLTQSNTKRARFMTPLKGDSSKENASTTTQQTAANKTTSTRSTLDILKLISARESSERSCSEYKSNSIELEDDDNKNVVNVPREETIRNENSSKMQASDVRYFSVLWCKHSSKKHKKWEGDAVLKISGRSAELRDLEGKQIGSQLGYKLKELEQLEDGSRLVIGSKQIEILNDLSEQDYKTGKCFINSEPIADSIPKQQKPVAVVRKSFCNPAIPRHDPNSPDALVMPPPNKLQQWENNKQNGQLVDVVVDPLLSKHLRPHQKDGICFMYECISGMKSTIGNGVVLADEMGLGKTLQCIALIWTTLKQGPYGKPLTKKILIVTPGSLVKNWEKEFHKWLGRNRIFIYAVDSKHKVQDFAKVPCCPVMIISYEMFSRHRETIGSFKFDLLVCDESHRLKNKDSMLTNLISNLEIDRRILLTGTPVQNELKDLYSLANICNPGILGSKSAFLRIYEEPIVKSKQSDATLDEKELGEDRACELAKIMSSFILRRTQELIKHYLPGKVENVVFCKPSSRQLSMMEQVISGVDVQRLLCHSDGHMHLKYISMLRKICNHPVLSERSNLPADESDVEVDYKTVSFDEEDSGKMNVLAKLLEALHSSGNEKVVVVSMFTKALDILQQMCERNSFTYLRLDGSTPTSKRQSIVEEFNSLQSSQFVFLLSSKAGGVGLNLIGASYIILYDIDWNPANDLQAMSRIWRDGQKRDVHIYRLLTTGTIEEKIFQRQIMKQNLSGTIVDHQEKNVHFTNEELKDLFTIHRDTLSLTHDLLECDCTSTTADEADSNASETDRHCQLLLHAPSNSNLSMADLMDWKHITTEDVQDELLGTAKENITFMFQSITKL